VPGRAAKVIVTAELPSEPGMPLKITVTPVGDATSLAGGTLLATPLRHTTGKVHTVAQGQIEMDGKVASIDDQQAIDGRPQRLAATE
jgi:flagellar P-ring protein precursor FlgI